MNNKELYFFYYKILKKTFPEYIKMFSGNVFLTLILSFIVTLFPYLLGEAVSYIDDNKINELTLVIIALLSVNLMRHFFESCNRIIGGIQTTKSTAAIRIAFMKHIYNSEHESQAKTDVGTVMTEISRCSNSFAAINNILVLSIFPIIFQILSSFIIMFSLVSLSFAFIFALSLFMLFMLAYWISEKNIKYYDERYQIENISNSFYVNRLGALYESAINNARDDDYKQTKIVIDDHQKSIISIQYKQVKLDSLMLFCVWLFLAWAVIYIIFFNKVDSGTFVTTVAYITQITMPFVAASQQISHLKGQFLSLQRGAGLFKMPLEDRRNIIISQKKIIFSFNDVNYSNISIFKKEILANETAVICGASGSGKSTLIHMLTGLNRTYSGNLLFCGEDVKELNSKNILSHVSVVSQAPTFIPGSIKENLLWGNSNKSVTNSLIINVLSALSLNNLFEGFDDYDEALEQSIDSRHRNLFGGEKKRLAIARAILKGNTIGIFDEPTSGLDDEIAIKTISTLKDYFSTLIIITHDNKIKEIADNVIDINELSVPH